MEKYLKGKERGVNQKDWRVKLVHENIAATQKRKDKKKQKKGGESYLLAIITLQEQS